MAAAKGAHCRAVMLQGRLDPSLQDRPVVLLWSVRVDSEGCWEGGGGAVGAGLRLGVAVGLGARLVQAGDAAVAHPATREREWMRPGGIAGSTACERASGRAADLREVLGAEGSCWRAAGVAWREGGRGSASRGRAVARRLALLPHTRAGGTDPSAAALEHGLPAQQRPEALHSRQAGAGRAEASCRQLPRGCTALPLVPYLEQGAVGPAGDAKTPAQPLEDGQACGVRGAWHSGWQERSEEGGIPAGRTGVARVALPPAPALLDPPCRCRIWETTAVPTPLARLIEAPAGDTHLLPASRKPFPWAAEAGGGRSGGRKVKCWLYSVVDERGGTGRAGGPAHQGEAALQVC